MTDSKQNAKKVALRLIDAGHTAYFAGGCVRDSLLGKEPKDYDIATSATPNQVQEIFPDSDAVGAHFGVIIVKEGGDQIEIATFRKDGDYKDSRRPDSVEFSCPIEDVKRRDFTVNGLFQNPENDHIIDFVHGQKSIKRKKIKCIGNPNDRFREDALRLLRAIRFATVLDFSIEDKTFAAIQENASSISNISAERVGAEIVKILSHGNRAKGFDLLVKSGLAAVIFDGFDNLEDTVEFLKRLEDPSLDLVFATIGVCNFFGSAIDERVYEKILLEKLRIESSIVKRVVTIVSNHIFAYCLRYSNDSGIRRFLAKPTYKQEVELLSFFDEGVTKDFLLEKEKEFGCELPERLFTGDDLIDAGLKPSPKFKFILDAIFDAQLNGEISTKEEALVLLDEIENQYTV